VSRSLDAVICGVGGQGTLLLSSVMSAAAAISGLKVVAGETHGQAQRGGTVSSHIRIREKEEPSPLVPLGSADLILSLERWESMRYARYLRQGGTVITASDKMIPVTASAGLTKYPTDQEFSDFMKLVAGKGFLVDASAVATELGEPRVAHSVLLGVMAREVALPFDVESLRTAISRYAPRGTQQINLKAFEAGLKGEGEVLLWEARKRS